MSSGSWIPANKTWKAKRPQNGCAERQYKGVIAQYDDGKGYGFIRCAEFNQDVFVHARQVQGVRSGDHVAFVVKMNAKGQPQAMGLRHLSDGDDNDADPESFTACASQHGGSSSSISPGDTSGSARGNSGKRLSSHRGVIKAFFVDKGYGFINVKGGCDDLRQDIFVHQSQINAFGVGDKVWFALKSGRGRPQATALREREDSDDDDDESDDCERHGFSCDQGERHRGTMKYIDKESGYGFIRCKNVHARYGCDVFVHRKHIKVFTVGNVLSFVLKENANGKPQGLLLEAEDTLPESDEEESEDDGTSRTKVGIVKSFDADRGYGFISCADIGRDVFLHKRQVKHFKPGDQVAFVVKTNPADQPQAFNLKEAPRTMLWLLGEAKDPLEKEKHIGEIKSFNGSRGFGFIECPPLFERYGRDVFIPVSQFKDLIVGDVVEFRVEVKRDHPQAHDVVKLGDVSAGNEPVMSEFEGVAPEQLLKKLHRACASATIESVDVMDSLLSARADPNGVDIRGELPLMVAALNVRRGEQKCRLLLEHRADIHRPAGTHDVPVLHWARGRVNPKFACYLETVASGEIPDCAIDLDDGGADTEF